MSAVEGSSPLLWAFSQLEFSETLPHGQLSSTGVSWVLLRGHRLCCEPFLSLSFRLKNCCQWPFFLVNISGIVRVNPWSLTPQIWLVQIGRLPRGLVLSKGRCLVQSSWNSATSLVRRIDIVKRQFIVLLDPKARPCSPCPNYLALA